MVGLFIHFESPAFTEFMRLSLKIPIILLFLSCCQIANAGWTKQNSGTLAWLHSIYFVDQERGWIVGSRGTLLNTLDGGKNWKQGKKFTGDNIRDVYFSDAQNGWLLCESDIYSAGAGSLSYLLNTNDGGVSWERVDFLGSKERIARIFFAPNDKGFAVGESGAFWMMGDAPKVWKKIILPVGYLMLSGKFTDNLHGFIAGGGGTVLATEDGGLNWTQTIMPETDRAKLNAIFFADQSKGWAVGEKGQIYFTNNGGKVWSDQSLNFSANITDVFFLDVTEGYLVADNGTIFHTTTAGNVWNQEQTNIKDKLEKIFFIKNKGFAVGFGGTVLKHDSISTDVRK